MAEEFEKRISAALSNVWDIYLFEVALALISSFLLFSVALRLVGIEFYYAAAPAAALGTLIYLRRRSAYDALKELERGNPRLEDKLMAAYDNKEKDNFIVRELVRDVSYDLDYLDSEAFVNMKRVNAYVAVCIIAAMLLIFLLMSDFKGIGGLSDIFGRTAGGSSGSGGDSGGGAGGGSGQGDTETKQDIQNSPGGSENIYGDSSVARIEGEDRELEMHPEYGEGGDFESGDIEGREKIKDIQDGLVQATAASTYSENIPAEMQDIVKGYFERLSGE